MSWTPVHELVRQPPIEQWLSPAPKNVIEYRRKMMAVFLELLYILFRDHGWDRIVHYGGG